MTRPSTQRIPAAPSGICFAGSARLMHLSTYVYAAVRHQLDQSRRSGSPLAGRPPLGVCEGWSTSALMRRSRTATILMITAPGGCSERLPRPTGPATRHRQVGCRKHGHPRLAERKQTPWPCEGISIALRPGMLGFGAPDSRCARESGIPYRGC
jgi:hypothetical protein